MADQYGAGGLTVEARTFYVKELLARAVPNFCFRGWGIEKDIPARGGMSLDFRRLERPAAATTALTEGTPPSATAVTWTHVVATLNQYGAYSRESDVAKTQTIDEQVSELVKMWGDEHMPETLDIITRNELLTGTTVQYAGSAGSRGGLSPTACLMLEAEVREAVATLEKNNVKRIAKAGGNYVLIGHPNVKYDFIGSPTGNLSIILQNAGARGDANPLFTGKPFDYMGVRTLFTSLARVYGSAGLSYNCGVFTTLVIGQGAYGESKLSDMAADVIVHGVGSAGALDPLDQFWTAGWKAALGVRILNNSNMVRIEHSCTLDIQGGN